MDVLEKALIALGVFIGAIGGIFRLGDHKIAALWFLWAGAVVASASFPVWYHKVLTGKPTTPTSTKRPWIKIVAPSYDQSGPDAATKINQPIENVGDAPAYIYFSSLNTIPVDSKIDPVIVKDTIDKFFSGEKTDNIKYVLAQGDSMNLWAHVESGFSQDILDALARGDAWLLITSRVCYEDGSGATYESRMAFQGGKHGSKLNPYPYGSYMD